MMVIAASLGQAALFIVLVIAMWVLPAVGVAKIAEGKGRSFALWLAFSLVFSWLWLLIAALIIRPYDDEQSSGPVVPS